MWLTVALALVISGCSGKRSSGPLPHEVYVWQRAWNAPVREALTIAQGAVSGFVPLAAEVSWAGQEPKVTQIAIDHAALLQTGRPIGIAMRIGPFAGPFRSDDAVAQKLGKTAKGLVDEAVARGLHVTELQIDFDCADTKLDGYRVWLGALRTAVSPVPVCITALPSWLNQRGFGALAHEAGRFVLQVHSVEPPRSDADALPLCDPTKARQWVEKAARFGVPFRVALPTYTYLAAFDSSTGRILGISAEGHLPVWPRDAQIRVLNADARQLSLLVQDWMRNRPAELTGVIWYRLPVRTDVMNWRWPTLAAIIAGHTPRSAIRVEAAEANPSDIALVNEGEVDEPIPTAIEASWADAHLVACDALEGFTVTAEPMRVRFLADPALALTRLSPGEKRVIGWVRLDQQRRIDARFSKN
ncbi:DUF3142 domain-containing protein [Verrucomicrobiota bacterium sgz303538]